MRTPRPGLRVLTAPSGDQHRPLCSRPGDSPCTSSPGCAPVSLPLVPACALCRGELALGRGFHCVIRTRKEAWGRPLGAQPQSEPPILLVNVLATPSARCAPGAQETPALQPLRVIGVQTCVSGHRSPSCVCDVMRPASALSLLNASPCLSLDLINRFFSRLHLDQ